jgi:dynein heavy chain
MKKLDENQPIEEWNAYVEKWFVFCIVWSIGASVDEQSRKQIDYILRDIESMFPHNYTVYEYFINTEK